MAENLTFSADDFLSYIFDSRGKVKTNNNKMPRTIIGCTCEGRDRRRRSLSTGETASTLNVSSRSASSIYYVITGPATAKFMRNRFRLS